MFDRVIHFVSDYPFTLLVSLLYLITLTQLPVFLRVFLRHRRAIYRKVAIIGPPKAGKTTLITAMLDRVLNASNLPRIHFQERSGVNEYATNIRALQKGASLPETAANRFFIYKFDYASTIRLPAYVRALATLFTRTGAIEEKVHIELADFAGDYTESLAKLSSADQDETGTDDSIVTTLTVGDTFLDWVRNADVMMFLIDGNLLMEGHEAQLGELVSDYKAICLHIARTHADASELARRLRVAMVATKVDVVDSLRHLAAELSDSFRPEEVNAQTILEVSDLPEAQKDLLRDLHSFLTKNAMVGDGRARPNGPSFLLTSAIGKSGADRVGINGAIKICLK